MYDSQIIDKINSCFRSFLGNKSLYVRNIGGGESALPYQLKQYITSIIPNLLYKMFDSEKYVIKGSIGKGRIADTPWVAIMNRDITTSTQHGVYLVFLVNEAFDGIYLVLGMGATEYGTTKDAIAKIVDSRNGLRRELRDNNPLLEEYETLDIRKKGYRKGAIFSVQWPLNNIESCGRILETYSNKYEEYVEKKSNGIQPIEVPQEKNVMDNSPLSFANSAKQVIYFGAPGTGKSNTIKQMENDEKNPLTCIRTTFHPDSDYATFVGCYKPHKIKSGAKQGEITYEFVEQAFLDVYKEAWSHPKQNYALVIEEINRGNCAQIFGDIFQLLDRDEDGWSTYPIKADTDIAEHLENLQIEGYSDTMVARYGAQKVGFRYMALPPNLSILATMNTSDQSLFPIDSAFKRRWDWKYVPITEGVDKVTKMKLNYRIKFDVDADTKVDILWWDFIRSINNEIEKATKSEDKKLGYFFCKAKDGVIDAETFVGKVVFYLWQDVFKDYGFKSEIFKKKDDRISFHDFYVGDDIDLSLTKTFIDNVIASGQKAGILPSTSKEENPTEEQEEKAAEE